MEVVPIEGGMHTETAKHRNATVRLAITVKVTQTPKVWVHCEQDITCIRHDPSGDTGEFLVEAVRVDRRLVGSDEVGAERQEVFLLLTLARELELQLLTFGKVAHPMHEISGRAYGLSVSLAAALLGLSLSGPAVAQEDVGWESISLQRAIQLALSNSHLIEAAEAGLSIANHQVREAWADVLPDISASASYARNLQVQQGFLPARLLDPTAPEGAVTPIRFGSDNTWNAGVVLGPQVTDWEGLDLAAARGAMTINGQQAGEGKGGDVMGHPLEALAWLANNLADRGQSLQKDMIVMTGSIVSTKFLKKGDEVGFVIDTLGEVRLTVA